ncbi:MAG: hypothetical protein ACR2NG_03375 [Acidimicrobiia bacterium]
MRAWTRGSISFKWWYVAVASLSLIPASCSGSEMTMTEYVDAIDEIFERGVARYEVVVASPAGGVLLVGQGEHLGISGPEATLADFTPHDLHIALLEVADIQEEALATAASLDPPGQIADLHALYFRELPIAQLAERAGSAADWDELSDSAEMAAYRDALEGDNETCLEFQATLDATADRGVFEDVPWMPNELKEIVDYALGCASLPQNPQDVYRP